MYKFIKLGIWITVVFSIFIGLGHAKAGGVFQNNYTHLTLDNAQTPPNCGQNCHSNAINGTDLLINLIVDYENFICMNTKHNISISLYTNESIDEVSCLLMGRTNPDGTGEWAQPIGVLIINNNNSGHTDNYQENTTRLDYILTILVNEPGTKELTLHCRGGIDTAGSQDWKVEYNITLNTRAKNNIIITMSDLQIYSFDIPILNKFIVSNNYIDIYENGVYISTNKTNGELILNSSSNYSINFKPSKKHLLTDLNALINIAPSYYGIILVIIIISAFIIIPFIKNM